ncbi:discoidin domain-containing protein [Pedobacter hiemivivus]|uniref:Discoidin domain-containing protein n=1 Tax=Pedobacter hiemivivus TaxID=2530454 RepID=A0A4R0N0C3_9SPHI|nr:discoidin domain-containing protein [Pedobacter hiemivivus]TCC93139.1 discoidin domain-containing protein [Pedobacter hiemivivus]
MKKTIILSVLLSVGMLGVNANNANLNVKPHLKNPISKFQDEDKELTKDRWQWLATASLNPEGAKKAIDNDPATRWETRVSQASGQFFILDMNAANTVSKIVLDVAASKNDSPKGYEVYMSNDGTNWGTVLASGAGAQNETVIIFNKKTAGRYIKVIQTGATGNYWSIHEFRVFGQAAKK